MTDLIKRLEAATEGSRLLDADIAEVVDGGDVEPLWSHISDGSLDEHWYEDGNERVNTPDYTTSIDAAMTLLPEGWRGKICIGDWTNFPKEQDDVALWSNDESTRESMFGGEGNGAPAVALCIAALKARRVR